MVEKPNIILVFTDQHRRDALGCYGGIAQSPHIDSLAAEGTVFENAYCVYPVCTPARASLQTGDYPFRHGMQNNMYQPGCVVHELPDSSRLLSRQLVSQGYSAGLTGKWHLGFGSASHRDPWYKDHDVESSVDTVAYPANYRSGSSLPTDLGYEGDDFPGHGGGGHRELTPWNSFNEDQKTKPMIHNMKRRKASWGEFEQGIRHVLAYGEYIDDEIGRLITFLKEKGIFDSSYIIFTCDHGNSLGAHGGLTDKGFHMYEETVHIPLIVKPPKGTRYTERVGELVNTTDLYSTILDIAGVPREEHERDGRSVLPLISGDAVSDWPDHVVAEFTGLGYTACTQRMIRQGDYKYVFTADFSRYLNALSEGGIIGETT
jgi:arylsulfatase A-like enzyme